MRREVTGSVAGGRINNIVMTETLLLKGIIMGLLGWALIFLVVAVIAAVFGFTGVAAASAGIAKLLFFIFLVVFVVLLIMSFLVAA